MTDTERIIAELREMPPHAALSQESFARVYELAFGKRPTLFPINRTFEEIGYTASQMADLIEQRVADEVTNTITGKLPWAPLLAAHLEAARRR